MTELLQDIWTIFKTIVYEWIPIFTEMKKTAQGSFGHLKETVGIIITIIAIIITLVKFLNKYEISTWGNNTPKKKKNKHPRKP